MYIVSGCSGDFQCGKWYKTSDLYRYRYSTDFEEKVSAWLIGVLTFVALFVALLAYNPNNNTPALIVLGGASVALYLLRNWLLRPIVVPSGCFAVVYTFKWQRNVKKLFSGKTRWWLPKSILYLPLEQNQKHVYEYPDARDRHWSQPSIWVRITVKRKRQFHNYRYIYCGAESQKRMFCDVVNHWQSCEKSQVEDAARSLTGGEWEKNHRMLTSLRLQEKLNALAEENNKDKYRSYAFGPVEELLIEVVRPLQVFGDQVLEQASA